MFRSNFSRRPIVWSLAALFGALLADLAENFIDPLGSGDGADVIAGVTEHHGRTVLSAILLLASAAFLAPAVFRLARLVEHRGRRIGRAATVLALLGALGHAALGGIYLFWAAMPTETGSNATLVAAVDRATEAGSMAILAPLLLAFPISVVVFFIGTVRGRLVPVWLLVPVLGAPVAAIVGGSGTAGDGDRTRAHAGRSRRSC
jgi:hypothetical protein